jgi:hypothetical protein
VGAAPSASASRRCVFCGQGGKLTDEHAWPAWITRELFQKGAVARRRWGTKDHLVGFESTNADVTVKRVCERCNTGWMHALEDHVIPFLRPWMRGERQRLVRSDQEVIAAWALKTAMMLQFTPMYRGGQVIPAHQYAELYARRRSPPDGIEAFIGMEENEPPPGALFGLRPLAVDRSMFSGLVTTRSRLLAYEATMIARHLVFKVLGHAGSEKFSLSAGLPASAAALIQSLWRIWSPESSGGVLLPGRLSRRA